MDKQLQDYVYPKFYAPYERAERSKYLDPTKPRPTLEPYMNNSTKWYVSNKLDGTNTRILWDGHKVEVRGRTNASKLQGYQNELLDVLTVNDNYLFDEAFGEKPVVIYGESFGGKIQCNPHNAEPQFKVFDMQVDGIWLDYSDVEELSDKLNLGYNEHHVLYGWSNVMTYFKELRKELDTNGKYFEGIVACPVNMPLTRFGERVITKIKVADFEKEITND